MPTDLIEKWRNQDDIEEPENYKPEVCPVGLAEDWTNTKNPGASDNSKWDWDLLVDLAYIGDTNPTTVQDGVETLLKALAGDEN